MSPRSPSDRLADLRHDARDVSMPVLDGVEATRLVKAGAVTRDARVIAHTANRSFCESPALALFAAVLSKPPSPAADRHYPPRRRLQSTTLVPGDSDSNTSGPLVRPPMTPLTGLRPRLTRDAHAS
jgi:CheY-like chemotaxis protein